MRIRSAHFIPNRNKFPSTTVRTHDSENATRIRLPSANALAITHFGQGIAITYDNMCV